jgi:predicted nucleic acid-binding protein
MLVIDASAIVHLLLQTSSAASVEQHVGKHGHGWAVPYIADLEVLSTLRRLAATEHAGSERVQDAVVDLLDLPLERYPHEALLPRIWHLRSNFTPYDAAYLALAENLADEGVPLLTTDARFARAARKHSGVEVLLAA